MTTPDQQALESYPNRWSSHLNELVGPITLEVAGYPAIIDLTKSQLERVYFPLLAMLARLADGGERVMAGLAGIPGSGKTTFAAALAHIAGHLLPPQYFVVVGMDGWHWPNAVLDQRTTCDAAGKVIPLHQRKGSPESFDVAALTDALRELRAADRPASLPVYDRRRHDPVPDGLTVPPQTRIVLVEGNYLLNNEPPWDAVTGLLQPKILLECDPAIARERIVSRHVRGGLTYEKAVAKYEVNDRLNIETVLANAPNADTCISLDLDPDK